MAETNKSGANPNSFPTLCDFCYLQHPAKRRRVRCKVASGKTPSTPTLLRWPSRWGLCGRCSHFGRTIHATPCQKCVWRHPAWKVIFGMRTTAHNATELLDAPQQHIMQLSCWMRSNSPQCCSWVAIVPSALQ